MVVILSNFGTLEFGEAGFHLEKPNTQLHVPHHERISNS